MTKSEVSAFIERMEEIGDVWEEEDVERVYGDDTLEDALDDRLGNLNTFFGIINTVINR